MPPPISRDERVREAANKFAAESDADLILFNAEIGGAVDMRLLLAIKARQIKRRNVFLIIVTEGGNADSAFRIGRYLQQNYEHFSAVVSGWCKSAGTLICIGAQELLIGEMGELGPLDVQLAKRDELAGRSSGLTIDAAFRSLQAAGFNLFEEFLLDITRNSGGRVTFRTAAEIAANITVGVLKPIFEQLDPVKIGDDYRSNRVAEEYAERLNIRGGNLRSGDSAPIETLVRGYPSHGFVIDRAEASSLFSRVKEISGTLDEVVSAIGLDALFPRPGDGAEVIRYLNDEDVSHDHVKSEAADAPGEDPGSGHEVGDAGIPDDPKEGGPVGPAAPASSGEP